jgi:hypothetical protein
MVTLPFFTPLTRPLLFTVAIDVLLELQSPFEVPSDKSVLLPAQTEELPVMASTTGTVFTVTDLVAVFEVQPLLTV